MSQDIDSEPHTESIRWTKKDLFGLGSIFVIVGIIRQWPILVKHNWSLLKGKDIYP